MTPKIYTRTGDKGTTSLFSGKRVYKNDPFVEALGTVDEANSSIGLAISLMPPTPELDKVKEQLVLIQHALFDLGASLATPLSCQESKKIEKTRFDSEAIHLLENWIDGMEGQLPALHAFILPGGHPAGGALHLARSLIRRAERCVIPLFEKEEVNQAVLVYLNRLSDYLFMTSRYVNHVLNVPETKWEAHKRLT